jgi:hypothetical protein
MLPTMKTLFIRIGIIVGIVVVAALGTWWFTRSKPPVVSDSLHTTESIAPLASVSPLTIAYPTPPSDWKTYSSPSMGFSVRYPSDWTTSSCGTGCVGWATSSAPDQLLLGIVKSIGTLAKVLEEAKPYLAAQQQVKVGANTWTKLTLQHPTTGAIVTSYFITRGSSLFEFGTATDNADILKTYGTMIASFTFLK